MSMGFGTGFCNSMHIPPMMTVDGLSLAGIVHHGSGNPSGAISLSAMMVDPLDDGSFGLWREKRSAEGASHRKALEDAHETLTVLMRQRAQRGVG
jgi:hypothetical protein